jgi:hypothetical protein
MNFTKKEQINLTSKEKERMINSGQEYVNIDTYEYMLGKFGLKLDLKNNDTLNMYFNNLNENYYLDATIMPISEDGIGWANIYSKFYKEHVLLKSNLYEEFKRFRNSYFTTYKGHIMTV